MRGGGGKKWLLGVERRTRRRCCWWWVVVESLLEEGGMIGVVYRASRAHTEYVLRPLHHSGAMLPAWLDRRSCRKGDAPTTTIRSPCVPSSPAAKAVVVATCLTANICAARSTNTLIVLVIDSVASLSLSRSQFDR